MQKCFSTYIKKGKTSACMNVRVQAEKNGKKKDLNN